MGAVNHTPLTAAAAAALADCWPMVRSTARYLARLWRTDYDGVLSDCSEAAVLLARRWQPHRCRLTTLLHNYLANEVQRRYLPRRLLGGPVLEPIDDLTPSPAPPGIGLCPADVAAVAARVRRAVPAGAWEALHGHAAGEPDQAIARRVGVTATRVSQIRRAWGERLREDMPELVELIGGRP